MLNGPSLRIGISGGSGFIGRNLTDILVAQGDQVLGFSQSTDSGLNSISNRELIMTCHVFVHLGEPANINRMNRSGVKDQEPATHLLDFLTNQFGARLLYASSAAVYGTNSLNPHKVTEVVHPYDSYTEMKIEHEKMILSRNGKVLRLSNIFGPGMSHETVIFRLKKQIHEGAPILVGSNSVRDYLYIDEAVRAIFLAIKKEPPSILNVGSGHGRCIVELVTVLSRVLHIPVSLEYGEDHQYGPDCSILDIDETVKALGWVPNLDFEGQLSKMFDMEGL